jgi:hypothetical protein
MANIKGLSDFQDKESDDEGDGFNDYYAGGEKRCGERDLQWGDASGTSVLHQKLTCDPHNPHTQQWPADPWCS